MIELAQVSQHEFDLHIRDKSDDLIELARDLFVQYGELMDKEPINRDEALGEFEKRLSVVLTENAYLRALLNEMNLAEVDPFDAAALLEHDLAPSEEVLDKVAEIRGAFDEAAEDYAQELADVEGVTLGCNVAENAEEERKRLSRFVIGSVLIDDRPENEI